MSTQIYLSVRPVPSSYKTTDDADAILALYDLLKTGDEKFQKLEKVMPRLLGYRDTRDGQGCVVTEDAGLTLEVIMKTAADTLTAEQVEGIKDGIRQLGEALQGRI